jgi:hypothetical protein
MIVKKEQFESEIFGKKYIYTPYYFVDTDGKEKFVRNLSTEANTLERHRMASVLLSLRKNKYKYLTFYCPKKDIWDFIKWVKEKNYTFEIHGTLFERNENYVDFHGNLCEYSSAFHFRIYDMEIVKNVIKELKSIKRKLYC